MEEAWRILFLVDPSGLDVSALIALKGAGRPLRGVLVVPDFIANAGRVICAAMEYRGSTERAAFEYIDERVRQNTRAVLQQSLQNKAQPRLAALDLAKGRVHKAMQLRRWH